jgi:hypothetical protein
MSSPQPALSSLVNTLIVVDDDCRMLRPVDVVPMTKQILSLITIICR